MQSIIIPVEVPAEKKARMSSYLDKIKQKKIELLPFQERREVLKDINGLTSDMINEQNKAFDKAIEQMDKNNKVSVTLDNEVSKLIDDGMSLGKKIMDTYLR